MAEIQYKQLEQFLDDPSNRSTTSVYLIFGESFLYEKAFEMVLKRILPDGIQSLCHEPVDVDQDPLREALDRVKTFSLLGDQKVVSLCNSRIFYEKKNSQALLEKAKAGLEEEDMKRASGFFLEYLGINSLSLSDFFQTDPRKLLNLSENESADWSIRLVDHCLQNNLSPPGGSSMVEKLEKSIEMGFPPTNKLVITADFVDKRRSLYSVIKTKGLCVDCSVPKGERKADKDSQNSVLQEQLAEILAQNEKKMDAKAVSALFELTGFDLHILVSNIQKLISFTGHKKKITQEDVHQVLSKTKVEPIFEITNALGDRNTFKTIRLVSDLMANDIHPLQILGALTNQVRKLLICKCILPQLKQRGWTKGMSFQDFKRTILPILEELDTDITRELILWDEQLNPLEDAPSNKRPKKNTSSKVSTDTLIAKNPNNPFPIFQLLLKADNYTMSELQFGIHIFYQTDALLKSTSLNPKLVLEQSIADLCGTREPNK